MRNLDPNIQERDIYNKFDMYQISTVHVLNNSCNLEYFKLFFFSDMGRGFKKLSSLATFSEDEILAANRAVLPTSTRKRKIWLMSLLLVGRKLFSGRICSKEIPGTTVN